MKHNKRRDLLGDDSPLDRPLRITFFDDIAGKSLQTETHSLREIADLVKNTIRPRKEALLKIKFSEFGKKRSAKGSLRHDANLVSFDAIELDYDGKGNVPIQEAVVKFKAAGLAALLYETASSTAIEPCWRPILPCSRAMQPEDRERLVARANGVLGGILAGESFSSSQFYYAGTVKGKRPEILLVDGRYIDEARELDAGAIGKRKKDQEATKEQRENDDTGNGAAYRKVMQLRLNGDTIEDFAEWATENPWTDYERNPKRAVERTWENAKAEAGRVALEKLNDDLGFEDLGDNKSASKADSEITVTMASEIEPKNINWFWRGRFAEGKGTMLTGLPGMGKSQLSINIAAKISRGGKWPDGSRAPKGTVLILASEDAADDTMLPRIIAAGGNTHKIGFIQQTIGGKGKRRILNLKDDLERLAQTIRKVGDVKLVIIDPITAYMGNGVDSHKATDVRAVLSGVSEWAQGLKIAVLAITHPAKAVTSAMNAMVGSQAYVAFFRMNFIAGVHPDDADLHHDKQRRVLSKVKGNNGGHIESLSYTIEPVTIEGGIDSSRIVWGEEVDVKADELVNNDTKKTNKTDEATDFLKSLWDFEPKRVLPVKDIERLAQEKGIAWRTIERAKKGLPIMPNKIGGKWFWSWRS